MTNNIALTITLHITNNKNCSCYLLETVANVFPKLPHTGLIMNLSPMSNNVLVTVVQYITIVKSAEDCLLGTFCLQGTLFWLLLIPNYLILQPKAIKFIVLHGVHLCTVCDAICPFWDTVLAKIVIWQLLTSTDLWPLPANSRPLVPNFFILLNNYEIS